MLMVTYSSGEQYEALAMYDIMDRTHTDYSSCNEHNACWVATESI